MRLAPDSAGVHPVVEQFAHDLYHRTPESHWPEHLRAEQGPWERISPELRDWFRNRARTFAAGDMRVAPWELG